MKMKWMKIAQNSQKSCAVFDPENEHLRHLKLQWKSGSSCLFSAGNTAVLYKGLWPSSSQVNFAASEEWCRGAQRHRQAPAHKGPKSGTVVGHQIRCKSEMMGRASNCKVGSAGPQENEIQTSVRMDAPVNVHESWA